MKTNAEQQKLNVPWKEKGELVRHRSHAVEFAFGLTVYKIQGQTCEKIILDLNKRPFLPHTDYHGLYVALSRVKQSEHLRVLPLQPMQTGFDHLFDLKPPMALTSWIQAYNKEGKWIVPQKSTEPTKKQQKKEKLQIHQQKKIRRKKS